MKPLILELDGNGGYLVINLQSVRLMIVNNRILEIEFKGNDKPRRYMLRKPLDIKGIEDKT